MSSAYHTYTVAFPLPAWLKQDIASHVQGLPVKPQREEQLHLTAITIYGNAEKVITAALEDGFDPVPVTLGSTNIYRRKSLAIDLLESKAFKEFQQGLVRRLRRNSNELMSNYDAKYFMDGIMRNNSLVIEPHITIANVFEYDLPQVPLSDIFKGREVTFDHLYFETDFKKNQRKTYPLTTARASPAPAGRRAP